MINDPIKYVRDRSTEDADCWLWRQACTSNGTPTMHQPGNTRRIIAVRRGKPINPWGGLMPSERRTALQERTT